MPWNEQVLAGLPDGQQTVGTQVDCFLMEYASGNEAATARLWNFLYNPQRIEWSREAVYAEGATYGTWVPHQQYQNSTGRMLRLPSVILEAWWLGKSVQPLLDGINALTRAQLSDRNYSPPVLSLVLGQRTVLAPCVLTRINVVEAGWLAGGQAARAQVDIDLLEVPSESIDRGQEATVATPNENTEGRPRLPLTERQRRDASAAAKAHIETQSSIYIPSVTAAIESSSYFLATDETTGDVGYYDENRNLIGTVGRWDGEEFLTPGITTLPKR
jgi:hypothetical protein